MGRLSVLHLSVTILFTCVAHGLSVPLLAAPEDYKARLKQAAAMFTSGDYSGAEARAMELLKHLEADPDENGPAIAAVLLVLVDCLGAQGRLGEPETRQLAERALQICESTPDIEPSTLANSLAKYASFAVLDQDWAAAREPLEKSTRIIEDAYGGESWMLPYFLDQLGWVQFQQGEYEKARQQFERALSIMEKTVGPEHVYYSWTLHRVSILERNMGDLDAARAAEEQALAIREAKLPPGDVLIADSLEGLGITHWVNGNSEEARVLIERALKIKETALGANHQEVATTLTNLGLVRFDLGDYSAARRLYERALAIQEKEFGPRHPASVSVLMNLGMLLWKLRDYSEAKSYLITALEIREEQLGPDHPEVAATLHMLGLVHARIGEYERAAELYDRARKILEATVEPDHRYALHNLFCRAWLAYDVRDLVQARRLFEKVIEFEGRLDLGGADGLARVHLASGDYRLAKQYFERAVDSLTQRSFLVRSGFLVNYARALMGTGSMDEAFARAIEAEEIERELLRAGMVSLPERQALAWSTERTSGMNVALTSALELSSPRSIASAWDALIRSRAIVLEEMVRRRQVVRGLQDPDLALLEENVRTARRRLANLSFSVPLGVTDLPKTDRLEQAARNKEVAEAALADKSERFRVEMARNAIGYDDVAENLPSGTALVAYARYARYAADQGQQFSYLGFVLTAKAAAPAVVDLGRAVAVESAIEHWRDQIVSGVAEDSRSSRKKLAAYRKVGEDLRTKIWDPLEPYLREVERVFIVPDGSLHVVSFASLPTSRGRFLAETAPSIHYLASERDLVDVGPQPAAGSGLLVVGGAAFDDVALSATTGIAAADGPGHRGTRSHCGSFQLARFPPLPGSDREAQAIAALWRDRMTIESDPVVLLTGQQASEGAVKAQAGGNRMLHIATHGFFLGEGCPSALSTTRGIGGLVAAKDHREETATSAPVGENPLLLSGLVFAGANRRTDVGPDDEDGILTAEEVATLDLSGVEWAVLSACDTGSGTIQVGEGVFGLRRAFQIAGARTVIMSLWPVEDATTRQWMEALYSARLGQGLDTVDAVQQANLVVLRDTREAGESIHPSHWAAFIAVGDWR